MSYYFAKMLSCGFDPVASMHAVGNLALRVQAQKVRAMLEAVVKEL